MYVCGKVLYLFSRLEKNDFFPPLCSFELCSFFFKENNLSMKKIFLTHSKLELQYVVEKTKPT